MLVDSQHKNVIQPLDRHIQGAAKNIMTKQLLKMTQHFVMRFYMLLVRFVCINHTNFKNKIL